MAGDEGRLLADDLVHTVVGVEIGLDICEDGNGAVRASAAEDTRLGNGGRDADGIVEGEAEGLVDLLTTLAAIEQVRLDVVDDWEERAAGRVRGDLAGGARHTAGEGTCK